MNCLQCKAVERRGSMKGKQSVNMVRSSAGPVRSAGLSLLLLSFFLYVSYSYSNAVGSTTGCTECKLRRNTRLPWSMPIFQCYGCCFSRAYPTPFRARRTMIAPKNFTSEATCCVAKEGYQTTLSGLLVKNHTECHCSTCYYHKI